MMAKLLAVGLMTAGVAQAQGVTAVPKLDLTRFSATWYEIASLPTKVEKKCVRDGIVLYASGEKNGRLQQVYSCVAKNGFADIRNVNLRLKDKKVMDGRLQTTFLFLLHRRQWVLAVDENYAWALVGNPNHKQLWVLSQKPSLDPAVLASIEAKAGAEGYDVSKLVLVPQTREGRVR